MEVSKPESALRRIRKERCKWCAAAGWLTRSTPDGRPYHINTWESRDCTAPSAEQIVEELAGALGELTAGLWQLRMSTAGCEQLPGETPLAAISAVVKSLDDERFELAAQEERIKKLETENARVMRVRPWATPDDYLQEENAALKEEIAALTGERNERMLELGCVYDLFNHWSGVARSLEKQLSEVYEIATREMAEPETGTGALVAICTVLEEKPK